MREMKKRREELLKEFLKREDIFEKYAYLIELGKSLPEFPEKYRKDENLVEGCQSNVWIKLKFPEGKAELLGDSDTYIMKGILYIVSEIVRDLRQEEVACVEFRQMEKMELLPGFSDDRQKGISFILRDVRRRASISGNEKL